MSAIIPLVPQKKFRTLDDFIRGQNNFYLHHVLCPKGFFNPYPSRPVVKRYFQGHQEQAAKIRQAITKAVSFKSTTPAVLHLSNEEWNLLFSAYKPMSHLVYGGDVNATLNGEPNERYLIA